MESGTVRPAGASTSNMSRPCPLALFNHACIQLAFGRSGAFVTRLCAQVLLFERRVHSEPPPLQSISLPLSSCQRGQTPQHCCPRTGFPRRAALFLKIQHQGWFAPNWWADGSWSKRPRRGAVWSGAEGLRGAGWPCDGRVATHKRSRGGWHCRAHVCGAPQLQKRGRLTCGISVERGGGGLCRTEHRRRGGGSGADSIAWAVCLGWFRAARECQAVRAPL
mmetsp:Transcript_3399/g.6983  ORF Transcript_3399/g.6983 Transcript_3399/m.6983 type:complete len:221 (-) Transcript_3399:274-936(-)